VAGVALGLAGLGLAAAFGLAALVAEVPAVYQGLRWAGVGYLLWLAWEAWRGGAGAEAPPPAGLAAQFGRGLATNLLNPKAAVFYLTALPPFLPPAPDLAQVLSFTAVYVAVATTIHGGIVALAGGFTRFLGPPERERRARRGMALALVGVTLWLLWRA
jgi:threonine/homoserine/homoserine lactone efflux protein